MQNIDTKYLYLPAEFRSKHDICFSLVGQIEELIVKEEYQKLKYNTISLNNETDTLIDGEDILDFLQRTGRKKEHDLLVRNHIIHALIIDTCYFLQEALSCSLKMRLSVAFSLLRKPFVYNLIVLLRISYEDDFIDKFNNTELFDSTSISNETKIALIKKALENSLSLKTENCDLIYDLIFSKENPESIVNISEKALHLSTTRNRHNNNNTEKQNLNFIFSTYSDNLSMWNYLYSKLPLLILFLIEVLDLSVLPVINLDYNKLNERLKNRINFFNAVSN